MSQCLRHDDRKGYNDIQLRANGYAHLSELVSALPNRSLAEIRSVVDNSRDKEGHKRFQVDDQLIRATGKHTRSCVDSALVQSGDAPIPGNPAAAMSEEQGHHGGHRRTQSDSSDSDTPTTNTRPVPAPLSDQTLNARISVLSDTFRGCRTYNLIARIADLQRENEELETVWVRQWDYFSARILTDFQQAQE